MAVVRKEVFLSYGREPEVISFVTQLKHDLEARSFSVWLDTEDIPAGCDWHGAIGTGLDQCRAVIAVITRKYVDSKFCTSELYTANGDRKSIFPVIFEDVDYSVSEKARGVKYVIGSINWTMFRPGYDDYHSSLERLVRGMKDQGLGSGNETDGPVSEQMAQLQLSPPPTSHPHPPPHQFHTPPHSIVQPPLPTPPSHTHSPSPSAPPPQPHFPMYPPQPPQPHYPPQPPQPPHPPHPPQSHQPYYPYPPPQGYAYPPYTGYPYPYQSPPHAYYPSPPTTGGQYEPPPPYVATSGSSPQVTGDVAKPPITPPQQYPPPTAPGYQQTTPTRPLPQRAQPTPPQHMTTPISQEAIPTFLVGMKLEAVDRRFPYFVCVATVMDRTGTEVLIHFDGWDENYDYWCPSGSLELHPAGWCERHDWELQKPLNKIWSSWQDYLSETDSTAAPETLFNTEQLAGPGSLLFKKDMRVEAKDRQNPAIVCVATIADIKDGKLLIHFDGWTNRYDYWCRPNTPDIHPPHWCGKNQRELHAPRGHAGPFKWSVYLHQPGPVPAPAHLFTEEQRSTPSSPSSSLSSSSSPSQGGGATRQMRIQGFKQGMRLEAKDRQYPTLTCVATITEVKKGEVLIHFDGWGNGYDYWCDVDSTDIHPMGWCKKKGYELQQPHGHSGSFNWKSYLSSQKATAAPKHLFTPAQSN